MNFYVKWMKECYAKIEFTGAILTEWTYFLTVFIGFLGKKMRREYFFERSNKSRI